MDVQCDKISGLPIYSHTSIIKEEIPVERFQYFEIEADSVKDDKLEK